MYRLYKSDMKNPLHKTTKIFEIDNKLNNIFIFNQFSEDIEFTEAPIWDDGISIGKSLDDQDITQIRYYLTKVHDIEPPKQIVGETCYLQSKRKCHHPVKKYIESTVWDEIPRIDTWLIKSVGCDDNIYSRMVSAKFLIAAVARVYNPGCKFDQMLILEGSQGIGKSTLVEIIAGDWYLDTNFNNHDKDLIDSMRGVFMIEISELSGMNHKDVTWLKSFLSKKVDRVRLPYAQKSKDFKRKCVFIGTYNPSGNNMYLRDDTGNRRFWPLECKKQVDFLWLKENRNQLWAEALQRFKNGEKLYLDDSKALSILQSIHEERELESPTHKIIKDWLRGRDETTMDTILRECLKISVEGKSPKDLLSTSTTIGIIMRKLKWRKGINDNRDHYYSPAYTEESWT